MNEAEKPKTEAGPVVAGGQKPPAPIEPLRGVVRSLPENRLKLVLSSAADMGNGFAAVLPFGTKFEEALEPSYWAHVAYKLRPGDTIDVHRDDWGLFAKLYVRDVSAPGAQKLNNRAVVAVIEHKEFGGLARDARTKTHEVVNLGPHLKWCVRSVKDQRVVKEGCGTAEEAAAWMKSQAA
jgi:hypothetical protein